MALWKRNKEQVTMISYAFISGFPKHLKPRLIIISLNRRSKWDTQLSVPPKVILQLANIAIKIQYTWLVSPASSCSGHRFHVPCRKETGRMIFWVCPTLLSCSVAPLLLTVDCISTSFHSHRFCSGRILADWEVRRRSLFSGCSPGLF